MSPFSHSPGWENLESFLNITSWFQVNNILKIFTLSSVAYDSNLLIVWTYPLSDFLYSYQFSAILYPNDYFQVSLPAMLKCFYLYCPNSTFSSRIISNTSHFTSLFELFSQSILLFKSQLTIHLQLAFPTFYHIMDFYVFVYIL